MPPSRRSKRLIRAEDLLRLRIPTGVDLSPDGRIILFTLKTADLARNRYATHLFRVPAGGGRPRRLARGDFSVSDPCWSPTGRRIAFVLNSDKAAPQVCVMRADGGPVRRVTRLAGGPVGELHWSPDEREILFRHRAQPRLTPRQKERRPTRRVIDRLQHKLDGEGFFPEARWHLYKAAIPGRSVTQLTRGDHDDGQAVWSADGGSIAFISNRIADADLEPDNDDLFVVRASGRGLRQVTRRFGPVGSPAWSADGRHLYYLGHFGKRGEWLRHPVHLYRISLSGGSVRDLTPELDQWPRNAVISDTAVSSAACILPYQDPSTPARDARARASRPRPARTSQAVEERLAILVNEQGACRIYSLPAGGGPLRLEFERAVNVLALSVNRTSGSAACCAAKIMDCGDIYALRLDGSGASGRLTHINRRLFDRLHLTTPEEVVFRHRGNGRVPIHGWILKPPRSRTGRRHPTILNIHGGPMAQFGYTFFHEMHFLAARGYVVVFTNPRGSSGYGLRFMNCIENRWGGLDYADLMAVADSMIRRPYVDPARVGVMGGSYGGFMTTWIVGHTRRFKVAVTERQVGNQVTQSGSSDLGFYRIYARGYYPWEKPLAYLRNSPNFYAARIRTPLLIIHSENDLRCPIAQAEELFTYLKLQRRTVEMVRFAGESHGLSRGGKPQNRRERLARIAGWFAKWL